MKLNKEFKIGLIVTVTLALLYWGFNFLKGKDVFSSERIFIAVYEDVSGLQRANPITINGLNVGQVRDMYFSGKGTSQVVIELVVKDDIDIPKDSKAKIFSSDLLGSKGVEIVFGLSKELAKSGDTLISETESSLKEEVDRQLKPLKLKAESIMSSIDSVMSLFQSMFTNSNTDNIAKSIEHIANSFENLENTTGTLDTLLSHQKSRLERILENIESITLNLKNNDEGISNIISNFSSLSDTLAKVKFAETMININHTMEHMNMITTKINEGQGSLGMLVNDDSLYIELQKSSRALNLLLEDIRLNPKKYVKVSVF